jgi:two-component system sensor histidine kinase VanS
MKKQKFPIEQRLQFRLFVVLILYTIIGLIMITLFQLFFSAFKNPVVEWLYWRLDVIYFFYLFIGLICIFYHYWRKPWNYLDEVITATQTVYEQNNRTI